MSDIFTTNSNAERFMGAQQRTAVRPDGSSNAEFFKARTDARALKRAGDNEAAPSPAMENSREAASADASADASDDVSANTYVYERSSNRAESPDKNSGPSHDSPSIGVEAPGVGKAAGEQSRLDNINIEDNNPRADGSASSGGGMDYVGKAVVSNGNSQNGEKPLVTAKTTQPGGSEPGFLKAYQGRNGTGKKQDVSPGKAAGAYEAAANMGSEDAAALSGKESGELPKLVNARAGAYISEGLEGGAQSVPDGDAAGAGGLGGDVEEGQAGIIKGDTGASGGDEAGVLENIADAGRSEKSSASGGDEAGVLANKVDAGRSEKSSVSGGAAMGTQAAGKDVVAAAAVSAASFKAAYAGDDTVKKAIKKEDGEEQATQKPTGTSSKKTAPQSVAPPGGEQADIPLEELALDTGEAADSTKLAEAVTGKEQKGVSPGFVKDHNAGVGKPDAAAMKNDGRGETMVQAKDITTGVEAAKKPGSVPKSFSNFGKLQEGVFNAVDRGVRLSMASGGQDAKLTLRPESLGELRIKLSIGEDGRVQSKIMVDNAAVKSMLDNDAARLKGIFNGQGLNLESFSVEVGSGWSGRSAGGDGSGFELDGRGAQRAYSDAGADALLLDTFVMAEGGYGAGGGLDLFA